jgi:hypothetical protein
MIARQGDLLSAIRHTLKSMVTYEVKVQQFGQIADECCVHHGKK